MLCTSMFEQSIDLCSACSGKGTTVLALLEHTRAAKMLERTPNSPPGVMQVCNPCLRPRLRICQIQLSPASPSPTANWDFQIGIRMASHLHSRSSCGTVSPKHSIAFRQKGRILCLSGLSSDLFRIPICFPRGLTDYRAKLFTMPHILTGLLRLAGIGNTRPWGIPTNWNSSSRSLQLQQPCARPVTVGNFGVSVPIPFDSFAVAPAFLPLPS